VRVHYVIMGCGRVGSSLAHSIESRHHTVAVIDVDVEAFRRLGPDFHGTTVKGVGFDRDVLLASDIEHADGFAAVSSGDNSNILAARVVRESFGVDNVVARIYDQGRAEVYERLGIPTVATVRWTADNVLRRLVPGGIAGLWRDPSGTVELVEVPCHVGWVGHTIRVIEREIRTPIPALTRYGSAMVVTDSTVLQSGDIVYAMVESTRMDEVQTILATPPLEH
jgi:trk system potassium uptake protein TrkA